MSQELKNYYYSDAWLELEMNLLKIRSELVSMIEGFEQLDCAVCLELKCKCNAGETTSESEQAADGLSTDSDSSASVDESWSPPAHTLPKPKWLSVDSSPEPSTPEESDSGEDVEPWIEASKKAEDYIKRSKLCSLKKALFTVDSPIAPDEQPDPPAQTRPYAKPDSFNFVSRTTAIEQFFKNFEKKSAAAAQCYTYF